MIIEDCKKKKKNLSMTWIDYRKAYDSVPHLEELWSLRRVVNTLRDLHDSSYDTKAEFNNCFIIHSK